MLLWQPLHTFEARSLFYVLIVLKINEGMKIIHPISIKNKISTTLV